MNIVFLGPQGSGKGTQADILARKLGLLRVGTGDLMRETAREDTELGRRVREIINRGDLVDDKTLLAVLGEELKKEKYRDGVIIDGVPRTEEQAKVFKEMIEPDKVFYLDVSEKESVKRLVKRGRHDDTPEAIKRRLELYHSQTKPVLSSYGKQGILVGIDGEGSIEEVAQRIESRLK